MRWAGNQHFRRSPYQARHFGDPRIPEYRGPSIPKYQSNWPHNSTSQEFLHVQFLEFRNPGFHVSRSPGFHDSWMPELTAFARSGTLGCGSCATSVIRQSIVLVAETAFWDPRLDMSRIPEFWNTWTPLPQTHILQESRNSNFPEFRHAQFLELRNNGFPESRKPESHNPMSPKLTAFWSSGTLGL